MLPPKECVWCGEALFAPQADRCGQVSTHYTAQQLLFEGAGLDVPTRQRCDKLPKAMVEKRHACLDRMRHTHSVDLIVYKSRQACMSFEITELVEWRKRPVADLKRSAVAVEPRVLIRE